MASNEQTGSRRSWLTPEEALSYLERHFAISYTLNTLYTKSSKGQIPVERPGGRGGPIRFDPDKLDAWALGEWSTEDASVASLIECRIEPSELDPCVGCGELPIDACALVVSE